MRSRGLGTINSAMICFQFLRIKLDISCSFFHIVYQFHIPRSTESGARPQSPGPTRSPPSGGPAGPVPRATSIGVGPGCGPGTAAGRPLDSLRLQMTCLAGITAWTGTDSFRLRPTPRRAPERSSGWPAQWPGRAARDPRIHDSGKAGHCINAVPQPDNASGPAGPAGPGPGSA